MNPKTNKPYADLKKAFGTACRLAGIRDLHWHDLRHTFGTRLAEAGCSEATIAELMGHSDPQTTRRYTHGTDRLNELRWKPCASYATASATNLPQRKNGCQSWQPQMLDKNGRDAEIRTRGLTHPKGARYQAAPRPVTAISV